MATGSQGRELFVVQILNTQHATWQGIVTWMNGEKSQPFRSALELIRLMDGVLLKTEAPDADAAGKLE